MKFKNLSIYLIFFSLLLNVNPLNAKPLHIKVTGGKNIGVPIAVANFAGNHEQVEQHIDIAELVRNDLHNSGQFRALPKEKMLKHPGSVMAIQMPYWRNFEIEHLVIGQIELKKTGLYDVSFQLINMYRAAHAPILNIRFSGKHPREFRYFLSNLKLF